MKLSIDDIKFSESYASTTVEVETGTYPCIPLSICTMHVSVPLVEGKALEQYKEELLAKARERIDIMYKEIVCGGELDDEIIIPVCGDITGEYGIKVANKNGKLSIVGLVGGASDLLGLLRNEIKPSELSNELLAEADKASTGGAMKTFLVEDGKIVMDAKHIMLINSPTRDNLEERVTLLERFATDITHRLNLYTLK
ncbi:hypothetical protein ABGY98_001163 [Salmonella enterica]|uniref:Uncharacterized protein n=2 Tax=Salmonella enterica TaxID=28901 RepID=A0A5U7RRU0_SALER|nr:hypothetical protein [Salmonella enterica]EBZ2512360.1 hypothetical protein [Salmonella enterica subsp. enterica serovar Cerro]ECC3916042.1 hypothetical protein [Salmonella enterica subsp. diarizonae]EEE9945991.1 hypothetical protein [Salmonella enterica subsp. enterica serovar Uzaramo]ELD8110846.1 hypothetical protein [Salmonella enterica subsp. enterica serovar Benin]